MTSPHDAPDARSNGAGRFLRPPVPLQEQQLPGLASRPNPRPDDGATSYRGAGRLRGRRALITGGDSGIGRAAAIAFAREGADVAINYLPQAESEAHEVVALIRATGANAVRLPGDIRDEGFCNRLVTDTLHRLGGIDVLVHVAARQHAVAEIADLSTELFDSTLKTNLYALFWITRAALPHMGPGSSIITTSSQQAFEPEPYLLDCAPTKAAIVAFTRALAKQVAKRNIRVNAVATGPLWTPLQVTGARPLEDLPEFGTETPFAAGQAVDLALLYVYLASTESIHASGQVIGESGGRAIP